jgi:serine/threonine protein kinase
MSNLPKLPSYTLSEKLGESLQTLVYKGYARKQPNTPLVLKLLKFLSSWDDQSRHLRQKVERLKVLHDPRACTPLALEVSGEMQFIVQPWFAGQSLDKWAAQQATILLKDFFTIACTLVDILYSVHEAGITHGGLKPHNILVQASTLTVRLTDFITPLDIRDVSHFIYDPEFVRGTLAYTSPEQTGRINYRVDFSTDLYSLGIVFYELLTGKLPFFSTDPLELIHSHLAEEAPKVHEINPLIPEQLSDIIVKLVLKQPEKRYQSASGLLADLLRCRDDYAATGSVTKFPVGLRDRSKRVIFISKMVGRYAEAELIQHEYEAVMTGEFRSVFISGLSGIGKTRLIQELQKPLVRNRGYFTSGKFDQYQKNIPYSSLIQALRHLMRTFLTESDVQVANWQSKILAAVGNDGSVITDVVPELEFIIGQQAEVAHLPPVEARNRFNNLFGRILSSLAEAQHP